MRVLVDDLAFPEGPVYMADGSVVVTEMAAGRLRRVAQDGKSWILSETGGAPNGAALASDGKLYVCNNGGLHYLRRDGTIRPVGASKDYDRGRIEVVDSETGKCEVLYDRVGEHKLAGPNDIVLDGQGGFWFTDSGKHHRRHMQHGGIYWAKLDGSEIREVIYPLPSPNGIGLSPDGSTLYVADTGSARLYSWDVIAPGDLGKMPYPAPLGGHLVGSMLGPTRFDSLAVSASGKICVATIMNGGIAEFWPDGGTLRHHPLPDLHVTNIAFGGEDMRTGFVTYSQTGCLVAIGWHEPGLKLFDGR